MNETMTDDLLTLSRYNNLVHNLLRDATNKAPKISDAFIMEASPGLAPEDQAVIVFGLDRQYLARVQVMLQLLDEYWDTTLYMLCQTGSVPFGRFGDEEVVQAGLTPSRTIYYSLIRPLEKGEDHYLAEQNDILVAKFFYQMLAAN